MRRIPLHQFKTHVCVMGLLGMPAWLAGVQRWHCRCKFKSRFLALARSSQIKIRSITRCKISQEIFMLEQWTDMSSPPRETTRADLMAEHASFPH